MNRTNDKGRSDALRPSGRRRWGRGPLSLAGMACLLSFGAIPVGRVQAAQEGAPDEGQVAAPATLEETRLVMGKWIDTQRIISKERNDWQQGKEILLGRLELVRKETAELEEKIQQARSSVAETRAKRDELLAEDERLVAQIAELAGTVTEMEAEVRRLFRLLPEPIQTKLQPLYQRMPENPETTKATAAERFQNVLVILNDINKANNEITVTYEVRNLSDGRPSEVRTMYVGLAQAYYVSPGGEAGLGRPSADGWVWEPSKAVAGDVLKALDIIQGKQTPAFVPLPVTIQ